MNVGTFVSGVLFAIVVAFLIGVAYEMGTQRVCHQLTAAQQRAVFDCQGTK